MANRYKELYHLQPNLFIENSPVLIEAGALLKDTVTDKVLALVKIKNMDRKKVTACRISIRAFGPDGAEMEGLPDYLYVDIDAEIGQNFGSKTPVYLPDKNSRKMSVSVTQVVFDDETVWNQDPCEWMQVPEQQYITDFFRDEELINQYSLEVGPECTFVPVIRNGLFQCTCGATNLATAESCYQCHRKYEDLVAKMDLEYLAARIKIREAEEKAAAEAEEARRIAEERAAEENRLAAEERRRKNRRILGIVIPAVAVITIIAALTPTVIIPAINNASAYNTASALLEEGSYDKAKSAFEALGDYKDSSDMALQSQYLKAESLATDKKYAQAIKVWESLGEYSDSSSRIKEAKTEWNESIYQTAVTNLSTGKIEEAIKAFEELGSYKDSSDLYKSASYSYACQLADSGEYENAIHYFEQISGYEDADTKKKQTIYNYACNLYDKKMPRQAIKQFENCSDYLDSASKILDIKYDYASKNKNRTNTTTYEYLKDLVSKDYPGAQSLYDELFSWKVNVECFNTNQNDFSTDLPSISKYKKVYCHIRISGGTPNETNNIKYVGTFPNGDSDSQTLRNCKGGDRRSICWWYDYSYSPHAYGQSGTLTFDFYNQSGEHIGSGSVYVSD